MPQKAAFSKRDMMPNTMTLTGRSLPANDGKDRATLKADYCLLRPIRKDNNSMARNRVFPLNEKWQKQESHWKSLVFIVKWWQIFNPTESVFLLIEKWRQIQYHRKGLSLECQMMANTIPQKASSSDCEMTANTIPQKGSFSWLWNDGKYNPTQRVFLLTVKWR